MSKERVYDIVKIAENKTIPFEKRENFVRESIDEIKSEERLITVAMAFYNVMGHRPYKGMYLFKTIKTDRGYKTIDDLRMEPEKLRNIFKDKAKSELHESHYEKANEAFEAHYPREWAEEVINLILTDPNWKKYKVRD